jgi:hypothetical protein
MKMEQRECSETLAYKIQMPRNYPEENIQHTEHGKSLKSRRFFSSPTHWNWLQGPTSLLVIGYRKKSCWSGRAVKLSTHRHTALMLRVDLYLLTPIRFQSMHRNSIFMTVGQCPPHTAWGIEASQESCGRKKGKKFSISMLQKLIALSTNIVRKYFSCVRGNVRMWSIRTPSP